MLAFSLAIGHHFMAADHGCRSHESVLELVNDHAQDPGTRS